MKAHLPTFAMPNTRRARTHLNNDLRSLARDASDLVGSTAEDLGENARRAREALSTAIDRVKSACIDLQDRSLESARAAAKQTDLAVRTHPYRSIGIAFVAGVVTGILFRRR